MSEIEILRKQLIEHEGLRLDPYRDSKGNLTIGVGRLLYGSGTAISEVEALFLLYNDIVAHSAELIKQFPVVEDMDSVRRIVLMNMAFNMGVKRLAGFKRMWAAIDVKDYMVAAVEMLDSKWAMEDVDESRSLPLANAMRFGVFD